MVYAVLVASALLIEIAVNLPLGSLPLALIRAHVAPGEIALVVGAGPIAALAVSVPIGGLADRFGRLRTIRIAACLCVLSIGALAYVTDPILNGLIMAARGIGITAFITAEYAYVSAVVAPQRAVSATATLGMVGNLSFATAPAAGFWLWQHGFERQQFLWAAGFALLGALILIVLPAAGAQRVRRSRQIFIRSAWLPAISFLVACTLAGGVNGALAIVTFHQRGIGNGALLFTAMATTTFGLRFFAGRLVDRFGARLVAIPTAILQCAGSLLAAHAQTPVDVIVAGACAGIAWSAVVPVGIGLLFEKSSLGTRGAAMGSYNLAFNVGATGGSLVAAGAAALGLGYTVAMSLCAAASIVALPWVLASRPARPARSALHLAAHRA